jgi:hypothetical protein
MRIPGPKEERLLGKRGYEARESGLSPFLLLDRKLHFGNILAWFHVLCTLEMNVAGWTNDLVST